MAAAKKTETDVKDDAEKIAAEPAAEETLRSPDAIVKKYMLWSMLGGLAPMMVDSLAVTAIQMKLLHALANRYNVKFTQNAGKSVIASLIGGLGSGAVTRGGLSSIMKMIPIIGPVVGSVTMPIISGASTYAIGKVFVKHFESGGTFLDFDPAKAKQPFEKMFNEGKNVAARIDKTMDKVVDMIS